ncbi:hypothetical protein J4449_00580 [Candidatus Woesearchaeota archaeon]|nr:hypothetical protein [Candidatus Woesearchaeota archaeon]
MSTEQVLILLVMLFVLAALFSYLNYSVKPAISQTTDNSACSLSVKSAAAQARIPGQGIKSLKELQGCKTQNIITDETAPDKVHELLADNVLNCWNNFGRGKLDFMKDFEAKDLCFVCYKTTFTNNIDTNYIELHKYMISQEKYKPLLSSRDFTSDSFEKISQNQKFYVVIVSNKVAREINGIFTFLFDKYVKFVVDEQEFTKNRVALVRSDKLAEFCKEIA